MKVSIFLINLIGLGLNIYTNVHLMYEYDITVHVYFELFVNSAVSSIYILSSTFIQSTTWIWLDSDVPCQLWLLFGMVG